MTVHSPKMESSSLAFACSLLTAYNLSESDCQDTDEWVYTFQKVDGAIKIIFIAIVVLENSLTMYVLTAFPSLASPTNTLLRSMACADCLVGVGFACGYLIGGGSSNVYALSGRVFAMNAPNMTSILHILIVGIDRCFAVFMPLRYNSLVTCRRMNIVLMLVWSYSIISSAVVFLVALSQGELFGNASLFVLIHGSVVYMSVMISMCLMHGRIAHLAKKMQMEVANLSVEVSK